MAYYLVVKDLNRLNPDPDLLDLAFWDYVFLGEGECPSILDASSKETGGLRFLARVARAGTLTVEERT